MINKYIPIEKIIGKVKRDYNIQESDYILLMWAGEALDFISVPKVLENVVRIVEITNNEGLLPNDIIHILQIVKYNKKIQKKTLCNKTHSPLEEVSSTPIEINSSCCDDDKEEEHDVHNCLLDLVIKNCNFVTNSNIISPIRKTTDNFFDVKRCENIGGCIDEYKIGNGVIYTTFKSGYILISYLRFYRDEDSVLLIPDDVSFKEAISRYIIYKSLEKDMYRYDKFADYRVAANKVGKAERDWHWYARQAKNKALALDIDDYQNMLEHNRSIVGIKDYYEYFSTLNRRNG